MAACTPLGLWVYDDPGLEVSRVRVNRDASAAPVVVGLAVWNPNDYDVTTSRLELELKLDDMAVGRFSRDSVVPVPTVGLADVALPLTVRGESVRQRISALRLGDPPVRGRGPGHVLHPLRAAEGALRARG